MLVASEKSDDHYVDYYLNHKLDADKKNGKRHPFVTELVMGVIRWKLQLDFYILNFYTKKISKLDIETLSALRMGIYQLKMMSKPDHATVSETVEMLKRRNRGAAGLANAVLRKVSNADIEDLLKQAKLSELEELSIRYSHPQWMIKQWISNFGKDEAIKLCNYNNTPPSQWIRVNRLKVDLKTFIVFLNKYEFEYDQSEKNDVYFKVTRAGRLLQTDAMKNGWFAFQDISSGFIAGLLEPKKNEKILDACASPGGKTGYITELMKDKGIVHAMDNAKVRVEKLDDTIQRLGYSSVKSILGDATKDITEKYDKILLDVPCSGTGVLSRRADARWNRSLENLAEYPPLQTSILKHAIDALLPGGLLVYSTCTLNTQENGDVVDKVLAEYPDIEVEAITDPALKEYIDEKGTLNTLPWRDGLDGMYAIKLRKLK